MTDADGPEYLGPETVRLPSAVRRLDEQRRRWRRGERPRVEACLDGAERPGADELLDLIYNEVLLREEDGERPQLGEYLRRFPELSCQLRAQFEVDQAIRATPPAARAPAGYEI